MSETTAKILTRTDLRRALADWYADTWQQVSEQRIKEQADYMYDHYGITTDISLLEDPE
ncbi:hypothetical protein JS533_001600 [Bifidobacterium amazonense]|uniref:Uncharacterized protein n=1 Tax=Bifidobacterium amazonense TaxID=2809027 RepID=A0ABS9VSU2_9BIFI|nr:hypothetical protein [Bifidobacterium amazonense]MCH9274984.1 hypothetical protein [Bifidobacterium amazonense]